MPEELKTADETLPPPKSAADHVAQTVTVPPRPHEDRSASGVPHPAHRSS